MLGTCPFRLAVEKLLSNLMRLQETRPLGQDKAWPVCFVVTTGSMISAVWVVSWLPASSSLFHCSCTAGTAGGPLLALLIVCCG